MNDRLDKPRTLDDFLKLFPESPRRKAGNGYLVLCPAHNDRDPSLWITPPQNADFIADWACQAGCKREDILISNGLTWDDVRCNSHKSKTEKTLVVTFSYDYAKGHEAYQIRRFDLGDGKKTFEVWHQKDGRYVSGMGEYKDKPILYHLPEIPDWIATGKRIYIPEGEGKADLIISKGGASTTSPFGAGRNKWRAEYNKALAGAEVIILSDNDKPGRDFAQDKAVSLYNTAKSVKVLELPGLPEKGDVIDWFNAGSTFEQLEGLAGQAPEYKPTDKGTTGFHLTKLSDLYAEPDEAIDYLWENTLIKGGLSLLVAKPKVGKSTLAQNLALALAKGEASFLGRNITTSGAVVYLAFEEKRGEVKRHFKKMGADENLPIFVHVGIAPEQAIAELRKAVIDKEALLAIVDPLQRLVRVPDLNDYSSVSLALEPLMQIARDTGCHILMIHHANKGIAREGGDSILGSTAIFGSVDCALFMKRTASCRTIESQQRYGEDLPRTVLTYDVLTGLTSSGGNLEDVQIAECGKAILDLLTDNAITEKEIKEGITDHKGGAVSKSLRLLYEEGKIQRQGLGKKGDPYLYATVTGNAGDSRDKYIEIPTIPTIPTINSSFRNDLVVPDDTVSVNNANPQNPEAVLGMPIEKAIEVWRADGAPAIPLGKGETCLNLEILLSNHPSPNQLEAVKAWLQKRITPIITPT